jgi:hypothetical protein
MAIISMKFLPCLGMRRLDARQERQDGRQVRQGYKNMATIILSKQFLALLAQSWRSWRASSTTVPETWPGFHGLNIKKSMASEALARANMPSEPASGT